VKHHQFIAENQEHLRKSIRALGLSLGEPEEKALLSHLSSVLHYNEKINLTAITDPAESVRLHIVDSLCLVQYMPEEQKNVGDIGSGAGYPGIPLAITCPWLKVYLLEANKKKHKFLTAEIQRLGLAAHATGLNLRAEEAHKHAGTMGLVVARAVASLSALVELAAPLLEYGGDLYAMKGRPASEEVAEATRAAAICGMSLRVVHKYTLPFGKEIRELYVFQKAEAPVVTLPRRVGKAQKRPFGR